MYKHTDPNRPHEPESFKFVADRYIATCQIALDKIEKFLDSTFAAEAILLLAGTIAIFLIVLSILAYA